MAADLGHSNDFNHQFWKDFRKAVKAANPNAIILAEHYGNPEGWLKGDEWDTVMNYDAFMEPLTWFLTVWRSTAMSIVKTCWETVRLLSEL